MKSTLYAYALALLATLPTAGYALSFSEELPEEGVVVTSMVLDEAPADLASDHYVCLGEGWEKTNTQVFSRIRDFKVLHPKILKDLGENQKNCFAPAELPKEAQKPLDEILTLIDKGAKDKLQITVSTDGKPNLRNDLRKLSLGQPINCYSTELGVNKLTSFSNEVEKFELRNEKASLGKKLLAAEAVVGGMELAGMGILISLPKSITKWEDDWMDDAKSNLKRAWTKPPVWDKDEWAINYIGHPLAGAAYYNMLRSQGGSRLQSFLFSTVQSTLWEYVIEGIAEQPSIQDLFITPVVGSLIGELAHWGTERMRRNGFTFGEKVLVTVINPSYVINNGFRTKNKKK